MADVTAHHTPDELARLLAPTACTGGAPSLTTHALTRTPPPHPAPPQ
ncbi:hypothetical protein [Streptomyces parvulus]